VLGTLIGKSRSAAAGAERFGAVQAMPTTTAKNGPPRPAATFNPIISATAGPGRLAAWSAS